MRTTVSGRRPAGLSLFCCVLFLLAVPVSHAQQTARAKTLGAQLKCVCGCNQVLTACNHVGCTYSHAMLKQLDERVARGDSDSLILQSFVQEYGEQVLTDPPRKGFNWLVWILPIAAPLLAFFMIWEVVRRWRHRAALVPAGGPSLPPELLDRARRESGENEIE
ncbi:MAG TPA: cytochrome c-type biogenesis protein [Candidatus Acidoferrales bacterium]